MNDPTTHAISAERAFPWWALGLIAAIALIEPITHHVLHGYETEVATFSGLHTADSAICLVAMDMAESDFRSPYATCQSPLGEHSPRYFAHPYHWVYGGLGVVADGLGVDEFLFMGWVHGLGAAAFLAAVLAFFRAAVPSIAHLAFLLYAMGGGIGGLLYGVAWAAGFHDAGSFEAVFKRFAMYDLLEGPRLAPWLLVPRFYYTASLACCFAGLALALGDRWNRAARDASIGLLFFAGAWMNMRFGVFALGVLVLYVAATKRCYRALLPAGGGALAGCGAYLTVVGISPVFAEHYLAHTDQNLWLTPFISASFLFLPPAFVAMGFAWKDAPRPIRIALAGLASYLAAFVVLFIGHQLYWGNLHAVGEGRAAVVVSDWALLGALAGAAAAWRWTNKVHQPTDDSILPWVALWTLLYSAVALSAFGQGWFLQFTPQRLVVYVGPPLAILAAWTLARFKPYTLRIVQTYTGVFVGCGLIAMGVATVHVQGPAGQRLAEGPFSEWHRELMARSDADLVAAIDGGTVLTVWPFSDVVAVNTNAQVVGGVASNDLSDQGAAEMEPRVGRFFSAEATGADRRAFVEAWCVDYVLCPATHPIRAAVLAQLLGTPWLETVQSAGKGILFRVNLNQANE